MSTGFKLKGEEFTVGGFLAFMPPGTTLADMQAAFPEVCVTEGWDPAVLERMERERQAEIEACRPIIQALEQAQARRRQENPTVTGLSYELVGRHESSGYALTEQESRDALMRFMNAEPLTPR